MLRAVVFLGAAWLLGLGSSAEAQEYCKASVPKSCPKTVVRTEHLKDGKVIDEEVLKEGHVEPDCKVEVVQYDCSNAPGPGISLWKVYEYTPLAAKVASAEDPSPGPPHLYGKHFDKAPNRVPSGKHFETKIPSGGSSSQPAPGPAGPQAQEPNLDPTKGPLQTGIQQDERPPDAPGPQALPPTSATLVPEAPWADAIPGRPVMRNGVSYTEIDPSYRGPRATAAQDFSLPNTTNVRADGSVVIMTNNHVPVSIWVPRDMASQDVNIITKITPIDNSAPITDQFIGRIVQTSDGPYLDGELWKNGQDTGRRFHQRLN